MENTWFEMSPYQKQYHQQMAGEFEILRENHHALHASLWLWTNRYTYNLPERLDTFLFGLFKSKFGKNNYYFGVLYLANDFHHGPLKNKILKFSDRFH